MIEDHNLQLIGKILNLNLNGHVKNQYLTKRSVMKKKILIFGGSGFVGINLAKFLLKKNYNILCTYFKKKPKKLIILAL